MSLESRMPKRVRLEAVGFACLLALMALDEYLDLPKWLFGEVPTPLRHHEFIMESTAVCLVAAIVITVVVGLLGFGLITLAERAAIRWKPVS